MHFTDYSTRLAGYAAIVDAENRLLLTWWNGEGQGTPCWSMPGGGIEYEESVAEGVVREVFEETGYVVAVGSPIAVDSFTVPGDGRERRPHKFVRIIFSAVVTGGQLGTTEVGGSTDFAEWVPLERIEGLGSKAGIIDIAYAAITGR